MDNSNLQGNQILISRNIMTGDILLMTYLSSAGCHPSQIRDILKT